MAVLTTTVGWFPKPAALRQARWRFAEGEIEAAELRQAEERATRETIELQRAIGIELPVDGQMDRGDMIGSYVDRVDGMEIGGLVRCVGNRYYRKPRIVGEVGLDGSASIDHWKVAQAQSPVPIKAIVTGPYTLMDWSFDEHYGSREACCLAMAEVVRSEVEGLVDAGATDVEIDEPAITVRLEELGLAARGLDRVTGSIRDRARTWCHLAYVEAPASLAEIFALPVDGILLEMANSRFRIVDHLPALPEGKLLGAGVVDVMSERVETADEIAATIRSLLKRLPSERLWITPDSGLRTLEPDVARAKLEAMVKAAAL